MLDVEYGRPDTLGNNIGTQSEPKKLAPTPIGLSVAMANYALTDTLPKTATTTATEANL